MGGCRRNTLLLVPCSLIFYLLSLIFYLFLLRLAEEVLSVHVLRSVLV